MSSEKEKRESAEAEVERLKNITAIQQKQIERLMEARDVDGALLSDRLNLIHHCYIHSNYKDCGFDQMDLKLKQTLIGILRYFDMDDCADALSRRCS